MRIRGEGRGGAAALALALLAAAPAARAFAPALPWPAVETASEVQEPGSHRLPVGAWDGREVPVRLFEGRVERRAWRLDSGGAETLALIAPLRDQLAAQGYETVFSCETAACGGFDFRYGIEALPEPAMHVDLGDFRFLAAVRGDRAVGLLVSRSAAAGFVQMIAVGPADPAPAAPAPLSPAPTAAAADPVAVLAAEGRLVIEGLRFDSGATAPVEADGTVLAALAAWLAGNPARRIALVGHTDSQGDLAANVAVSRARAEAVRAIMVAAHGAPEGQIAAEGAGWLAPVATNLTPEGRARNRRVEAVVLAAE